MATLHTTGLADCCEVRFRPFHDARGLFLKTYHEATFRALGLCTDWREEFVSTSAKGVLRGMHFQVPPEQHTKLVICLAGRVLDVVLDLRAGSPTYGACASVELSPERANALYVPAGFAHGFLALEDGSTMLYKVSSMHAPAQDQGLRWDSIGFDWPITAPILSMRDAGFGALADFQTPFRS
jgi:dTDP-4-dehydrorhamnose 3,5-epimerase